MATPPAFTLVRRRCDADVHDREAVRAWILQKVEGELLAHGSPLPRIYLVGDEYEESLDLGAVARQDPDADIGATFLALTTRAGIEHAYLVLPTTGTRSDGEQTEIAAVFSTWLDENEGNERVYEYFGLPFGRDPSTGVALARATQWSGVATADLSELPSGAHVLLVPQANTRAAEIRGVERPEPDIKSAYGEFPVGFVPPATAQDQAHLVLQMVAPDIVKSGLLGVVVLRTSGREWQRWVLGNDLPTDRDDMVRVICSHAPPVDSVATVLVGMYPIKSDSPRVGIQAIAERNGQRYEAWAELMMPEGREGPKSLGGIMGRELKPPGEGEGWIGVEPLVNFSLFPLGAAES